MRTNLDGARACIGSASSVGDWDHVSGSCSLVGPHSVAHVGGSAGATCVRECVDGGTTIRRCFSVSSLLVPVVCRVIKPNRLTPVRMTVVPRSVLGHGDHSHSQHHGLVEDRPVREVNADGMEVHTAHVSRRQDARPVRYPSLPCATSPRYATSLDHAPNTNNMIHTPLAISLEQCIVRGSTLCSRPHLHCLSVTSQYDCSC